MGQWTLAKRALAFGLTSLGLTLAVWAYIIARAPPGAFHDQGRVLISFLLFPLTFLAWAIGGSAASSSAGGR